MSEKMREKYGEYLVAHRETEIKLAPIAFSEVDAWYSEFNRIKSTPRHLWGTLDNCELRRAC